MGGRTISTSAPRLNHIALQSSTLGVPITIGWGRARIKCNLLWYNAFTAIPHTTQTSAGKGFGGGSKNTTYSYTASLMLGICEGPIQGVRTVYRDKSVFTGTTALLQAKLSLANGVMGQPVWGYLTSRYPTQALAYSGIAYLYAQDYALNDSATLPNHTFEVDFAVQLAGLPDADPRDVLTDLLTAPAYGVPGWYAGLNGDWSDWSLYCRAANLVLSPALESQVTGASFIQELMDATNSEAWWSEGVLKVKPYGDATETGNGVTWTPNLTPVYDLGEDDLLDDGSGNPVKMEIIDLSDAYNVVQVEYSDRANQYNTAIATAQDLSNIVQFGRRKQNPKQMRSICDKNVGQKSAQLWLQRTLYRRDVYKFALPWNFARLDVCDYVTLTTTTDELRLSRQLVQITDIEEDEEGHLAFTAEGIAVGVAGAAQYSPHSGNGYAPNANVDPGAVSPPYIFNAATSLTGGDPQVWCAVGSANPNWGGCDVWASFDNVTYSRVGTINGSARYGITTTALAIVADPDTTSTLGVDLTTSGGTLGGVSQTVADQGGSLCIVDGELLSYRDATLTGANTYNLAYLRRGLRGSTDAAHVTGKAFARLDDAIFKFAYPGTVVGSTIYVKFVSFNIFGRAYQDISTLSPYTIATATNTVTQDPNSGLARALSVPYLKVAPSVTIQADSTGTIVAGQLPRNITTTCLKGGVDVTSTSTVAITGTTACTATAATGSVTITACTGNGSVSGTITPVGGYALPFTIIVNRPLATATVPGGSSATLASSSSLTPTSGAAYNADTSPNSGILMVVAPASGTITLTAPCTYYATDASPSGSYPVYGKWRWRLSGGSWADVAAETLSTYPEQVINEPPIRGQHSGSLTVNTTKTGLASGSTYEFGFHARNSSGTRAMYFESTTVSASQ